MKKEIKIAIKSIIFLIAFGFIYTYVTQSTSKSKLSKIVKYEKLTMPLTQQFMDEIHTNKPDTIVFEGEEWLTPYNNACDSADNGDLNYMMHFLDTNSNMTKKQIIHYLVEFKTIVHTKWRAKEILTDYEIDMQRLTTRFPSNLILTEYKTKNKSK